MCDQDDSPKWIVFLLLVALFGSPFRREPSPIVGYINCHLEKSLTYVIYKEEIHRRCDI